MRVNKIRIQNFRCIADTGEIPLDSSLTIFVGANESGKTAILKALWYFNEENNFENVDVSTLSGVRERLEKGQLSPSDIEMVTLWLSISSEEGAPLGLPAATDSQPIVRVVKTLANEYSIQLDGIVEPEEQPKQAKLVQFIGELKTKITTVYKGRIKRKLASDAFVWLERFEGENTRDNLVLFPEWSLGIWDELQTGDWLQVTRVASDPYDRNTRALNAGLAIDSHPFEACLDQLLKAAKEEGESADDVLRQLRGKLGEIPKTHPLREYLSDETIAELARLSEAGPLKPPPSHVAQRIRELLPEFVYLSDLSAVSDSVSIRSLTQGPTQEDEVLLASLTKIVGLQPAAVVQENIIDRRKVLGDKSALLTRRLGENWFKPDLEFELHKDGQRLGLWISSGGSGDPPSRRSKGLAWYISLFAQFAQLSTQRNIIALLDDPGVYLHPVAQRQVLPLIDSQPFQILMATHLPFMIDPDHLERIRVVRRFATGTRASDDWDSAKEDLLPVWGSLVGTYLGSFWLIVEGPRDKRVYSRMSAACAANGLPCLPDIPIVSGGGGHVVHLVAELTSRGIHVVVALDGDQAGREMKATLAGRVNKFVRGVFTLGE